MPLRASGNRVPSLAYNCRPINPVLENDDVILRPSCWLCRNRLKPQFQADHDPTQTPPLFCFATIVDGPASSQIFSKCQIGTLPTHCGFCFNGTTADHLSAFNRLNLTLSASLPLRLTEKNPALDLSPSGTEGCHGFASGHKTHLAYFRQEAEVRDRGLSSPAAGFCLGQTSNLSPCVQRSALSSHLSGHCRTARSSLFYGGPRSKTVSPPLKVANANAASLNREVR
ncbi:MAG: hypothetical protein UT18_C0029G0014 [candidate division CPR2 bacterium GW2011_GWC2_39_10]|uniref:Uncharacterized protein n=1 Tax=candidate division CPR2 bacterium GW2011_GWC2_39_10 TaxID=1618345 RepID=A0A0G0LPP1_UNCC2|nr:MAG: hypothetical protein UT18_C0029G0014 [candidate division CPR2 bacterium GW2011_GWC2_39_10]